MDWKQYALNNCVISPEERKLLKEGPKSLAQAWRLQALKFKYSNYDGSRNSSGDVED